MDNKNLAIIGVIIIVVVIIICAFAFVGGVVSNVLGSASNQHTTGIDDSGVAGDYQLQINTSGKWRLDLTVDGKYSSEEGEGSKTIKLGDSLKSASVTVNQKENGPTNVYLLKDNKVIDKGTSNSEGTETIYFYYEQSST